MIVKLKMYITNRSFGIICVWKLLEIPFLGNIWSAINRRIGWDMNKSLMSVDDTNYQRRNKNINIFEVWILLKTYSQKLRYILIKICHSCIYLGIFLGFINTKIRIKCKLLSLQQENYLHCFTNLPHFWGKWTLPYFLENKYNSNPHLFYNVGEIFVSDIWYYK